MALGNIFSVPKTPEASVFANVLDSFAISSGLSSPALLMVSLKSSKTKIPSPASSLSMFCKINSSACGLN